MTKPIFDAPADAGGGCAPAVALSRPTYWCPTHGVPLDISRLQSHGYMECPVAAALTPPAGEVGREGEEGASKLPAPLLKLFRMMAEGGVTFTFDPSACEACPPGECVHLLDPQPPAGEAGDDGMAAWVARGLREDWTLSRGERQSMAGVVDAVAAQAREAEGLPVSEDYAEMGERLDSLRLTLAHARQALRRLGIDPHGDLPTQVAASEAETDALRARVAELEGEVEYAAGVFMTYADMHEEKDTASGREKGLANRRHAMHLREALRARVAGTAGET